MKDQEELKSLEESVQKFKALITKEDQENSGSLEELKKQINDKMDTLMAKKDRKYFDKPSVVKKKLIEKARYKEVLRKEEM